MSTRRSNSHERRRSGRSGAHTGTVKPFDFRRPTSLSREHVRAMQIVQETFARGLATAMSAMVGSVVNVTTGAIEQRTYDEYVRELPNPTLLSLLNISPLNGAAILQFPLPVAMCTVEMLLGGKGYQEQPARSLSELEMLLVKGLIERVLPELRYALEPVVATEISLAGQESNPQFAQVAAPTDMMIIIPFQIKVEQVADVATLCVPFTALQPHLEALSTSASFIGKGSDNAAEHRRRMSNHLGAAPVEVAAEFRPVIMSSGDVVSLRVGDVVPLSHPVGEPLLLTVEGVPTLTVSVGRRNRRAAIQVVGSVNPSDKPNRPTRWAKGR
jgi:flagellar motor switch protein FliM